MSAELLLGALGALAAGVALWFVYKRGGWPAVVGVLGVAGAALAALWPRRTPTAPLTPPPPSAAPGHAVKVTAGDIIRRREEEARDEARAPKHIQAVADDLGDIQ